MKRSWIGLGMLLVLLCGSGAVTWAMDRIHEPIAGDLKAAASYALLDDQPEAQKYALRAEEGWKKWAHFRACFADHTPIEEIDAGFAELDIYRLSDEETAFAASCGELARKVEAVGEAHGLVWWNLF